MAPRERALPKLPVREPVVQYDEPPADVLEAFIQGGGAGASRRPETPRSAPKRPRAAPGTAAVLTRSDGTRDRKATVYFQPEVDDALEAFCLATGRQRKHVVNEAVREYLARRRNRSG